MAKKKSITDRIGGLIEIDWKNDLLELQPEDAKVDVNHNSLKESLLSNGFALPFFVWKDNEQYFCIDGHTRKQVLSELASEGVNVPKKLKALEINCKDRKEAIDILVSVYNQKQNKFDEKVLLQWLETEEVEVRLIEAVNIEYINPFNNEKDSFDDLGGSGVDDDDNDLDDDLLDGFDDVDGLVSEMEEGVKKSVILVYNVTEFEEEVEPLISRYKKEFGGLEGFLKMRLKDFFDEQD